MKSEEIGWMDGWEGPPDKGVGLGNWDLGRRILERYLCNFQLFHIGRWIILCKAWTNYKYCGCWF
jgi:hypothetical protein